MAYPELLALIDYKLARLKQAREILSSAGVADQLLTQLQSEAVMALPHSPENSSPTMPKPSVTAPAATTAEPAAPAAALAQPQPAPRTIVRSRRFERRGPRGPRKPAELLPSALRSAPPSGPVFVPAARVQRNTEHTARAESTPPPAEPLTASLLARRWLNATS